MYTVRVAGIEIVQAIQNAENEVLLIAGKRTFARVYLQQTDPSIKTHITGTLTVGSPGPGASEIKSTGSVPLCGLSYPSVDSQRLHWSQSLNFELPAQVLKGTVTVTLTRLTDLRDGTDLSFDVDAERQGASVDVTFEDAPELRCKCIAIRYVDPTTGEPLEPLPEELDSIRTFAGTAFPIAKLHWSSVSVEAASAFQRLIDVEQPTLDRQAHVHLALSVLFRQLLAIRNQDLWSNDGREELRTLYLAVLSDPTGDFGGAAMDAPDHPAPHTVAVASLDATGELGAHELAHALGRKHPGHPRLERHGPEIGQRREDKKYPYKYGFISAPQNQKSAHLGLDFRIRGGTPRVLRSNRWFDLMTYRSPKWISCYTYAGIFERLRKQQEAEFEVESESSWTVVGEYDSHRVTGKIWYVLPARYRTPVPKGAYGETSTQGARQDATIHLACDPSTKEGKGDELGVPHPVYVQSPGVSDIPARKGVFQYTIEHSEPPARVRLLVGEHEVDRYESDDPDRLFDAIGPLVETIQEFGPSSEPAEPVRLRAFMPLGDDETPEPPKSAFWQHTHPKKEEWDFSMTSSPTATISGSAGQFRQRHCNALPPPFSACVRRKRRHHRRHRSRLRNAGRRWR